MKINEILNEAGEPENPSRRGFLRALGAAGLAAAVPGAAAQALSTPAAAAEVPAAAATAAGESGLISRLWMAAADYWSERMMDDAVDQAGRYYDDDEDDDEDYDDEDDEYDDGWDEDVRGPNEEHRMPWGEPYDIITTPSGHTVLYTSDPDGTQGIFTYEKDGQVRYIALSWDSYARDYGEVVGGNSEEDEDLYYAFADQFGGDLQQEGLDELFDYIIDGPEVPSGHYSDDAPVWHQYPDKAPQTDKTTAADTTAADLARLAGLVQKGGEKLSQVGEPAEPPAAEPPKPQALPAPEKPDFDLTPDLKQKQKEPVRKKPNES